jgi:hypothetical protein
MNTSRWAGARVELIIAAVVVVVVAVAAAAMSGAAGVVITAAVAAAIALLLLRSVVPSSAGETLRLRPDKQQERIISGWSRRRYTVAASVTDRAVYETDLRPVLEHILAARLAEHHSVNLYTEPEAARRAFCRTQADASLWEWVDPQQVPSYDSRPNHRRGIPSRTLNQLITRLEQL